jgi:hypothetical protein
VAICLMVVFADLKLVGLLLAIVELGRVGPHVGGFFTRS